jgi:hypothetical protein
MTLMLDLTPDVDAAIREAARRKGRSPEQEASDALRSLFAPDPPVNVIAWEAMLDSFAEGDAEDQHETLTILERAIDEDRPGQRRIFGEGYNP